MPHAQERIAAALNEAYAPTWSAATSSAPTSASTSSSRGRGAYIVGEETALIESLEGNRGMPRLAAVLPGGQGPYMQPTIVNNVETLSNLPWLFCHGVDRYHSIGNRTSPGTRLVALSGQSQPGRLRSPGQHHLRRLSSSPERYGGGIRGVASSRYHPRRRAGPVVLSPSTSTWPRGPSGGAGSMLGSARWS